jgi:hypothetical protein
VISLLSKEDETLETLLDLDGEVFPMDNGYWTKFRAKKVDPSPQVPHGIEYCLTLHNRNNMRVMGFDNAHYHKPKRKKYGAIRVTWDHRHKAEVVSRYEFESASQLLVDFWEEAEKIMEDNRTE